MKRTYLMEITGEKISSENVDGFLHKARTNRGTCELHPESKIEPGDEYVRWNHFGDFLFHKNCFGLEEEVILVVATRIITMFSYPYKKKFFICKTFKVGETLEPK